MPDRSLRPRSGSSARALLLTMLGELVLPAGGRVWTSTIIDGLARLGVTDRNARQAAARLGDDGWLVSERIGRVARWELTADGRRLLEDGSRRIRDFAGATSDWDHRWLVVLATVHEDERAKRHHLRNRLGFMGFGFLGAGVAVSPHVDREPGATGVLAELGLHDSAAVWIAETGSFVSDGEIMRRAWRFDELAERYRGFVAAFDARRPADDGEAFAALVELVHAWRRFPFDDPELPDELLPADWPGKVAKELFDERRAAWSAPASRWFTDAETGDPAPSGTHRSSTRD